MKRSALLVLLIVVAVFVSLVGQLVSTDAGVTPTISVTIGHIAPFTGETAIYGKWEKEGIQFALDEIATIKTTFRMTIVHEDDQGEPKRAVSAMQKLISVNHSPAVIGATLSSTTLACAPIANENKVVLLSPSAQSPKISDAGPYVFRIFVSSTVEGRYLTDLAEKLGIKTASFLYVKNDYGLGLENVLARTLPKHGIEVQTVEEYLPDQVDFSTLVAKTIKSKPDALFLLGYPRDMARAIKQARQLGFPGKLIAPASYETEEVFAVAGTAADGVFYVYPVLPNDRNSQELARRFRENYHKEMNVYHAVAYDAVMLFQRSLESVVSTGTTISGEAIKNALETIKLPDGASGPIVFDANGDAIDRPMEARISKGKSFEALKM